MRRAGFTLVEVIVVISILAFLMAILSPLLSRSREQARMSVCASKIRDILVCLQTYDPENGSLPWGLRLSGQPPPGGYVGDGAIDPVGWWWFNDARVLERKSIRGVRGLQCPSRRVDEPRLKGNILHANYGMNLSLCRMDARLPPYDVDEFQGPPVSLSTLTRPGETFLVGDSGYALICWWNATKEPPVSLGNSGLGAAYIPGLEINAEKTVLPGEVRDAVGGRHPGRTINLGFVDGHVCRHDAGLLLVEKIGENEWTTSPVWRPK
ncbi:MAG: prepilin-type N-terminal cleavage/methylation domain-containing protein [Sedimentisphaerales bacterium]|nr:prepilin-type N-terminal cleavage/methylation domain-containing protein [Sedimentisphaerales bacterium]